MFQVFSVSAAQGDGWYFVCSLQFVYDSCCISAINFPFSRVLNRRCYIQCYICLINPRHLVNKAENERYTTTTRRYIFHLVSIPADQLIEPGILGAYHPKIIGSISSGNSKFSRGSWWCDVVLVRRYIYIYILSTRQFSWLTPGLQRATTPRY